jgi:hypothetical protein
MDVLAALGEPGPEIAADPARADDGDLHRSPLPEGERVRERGVNTP